MLLVLQTYIALVTVRYGFGFGFWDLFDSTHPIHFPNWTLSVFIPHLTSSFAAIIITAATRGHR